MLIGIPIIDSDHPQYYWVVQSPTLINQGFQTLRSRHPGEEGPVLIGSHLRHPNHEMKNKDGWETMINFRFTQILWVKFTESFLRADSDAWCLLTRPHLGSASFFLCRGRCLDWSVCRCGVAGARVHPEARANLPAMRPMQSARSQDLYVNVYECTWFGMSM